MYSISFQEQADRLKIIIRVLHRLTIHPLAKYPGPFLAKATNFYAVYHAFIGDMHLDLERCHKKYGLYSSQQNAIRVDIMVGTFVRYRPNGLVVGSTDGFHGEISPATTMKTLMVTDIYGPLKKVTKSQSYMIHGPGNFIGIRDKKDFARKKRFFGQKFSDTAVREHEHTFTEQISLFCDKVSDLVGADGWSTVKNLTPWCMCPLEACVPSDTSRQLSLHGYRYEGRLQHVL